MIAIIDYNTGNLFSLASSLERLGAGYIITSSPEVIRAADYVILPGVGEASTSMTKLVERGLDILIPTLEMPVLGICIGMQLMCRSSEEGAARCMRIFDNEVVRLKGDAIKVPHMGWNRVYNLKSELFTGIDEGEYLYFVHSYAPSPGTYTIASTEHGTVFSSAIARNNFFGTQFHPEKSGAAGERILKNFINIIIPRECI
ncbi:MAG: imidazole glycerol phosphate synthase subunit HisH [Bacteroidales bacterium]|jgi:glutamine amidotransferase